MEKKKSRAVLAIEEARAKLFTFLKFVEQYQLSAPDSDVLLTYVEEHMDGVFTKANLTEAHKNLMEQYFETHPEERTAVQKWTQTEIDAMSASEFKEKVLNDPEFAAFVNESK